mmetsp:Transcript_1867/g.2709  ORF Transcript_1867/g.2709 Transcript_1867/m.2709 type:complete len:167 (+) Transcript_1867:325-825(+)
MPNVARHPNNAATSSVSASKRKMKHLSRHHRLPSLFNSHRHVVPSYSPMLMKSAPAVVTSSKKTASKCSMEDHQLNDGITTKTSALLSFLQNECPFDLIPKIMSFAGHETVRNMTCCSKDWKSIIEFEGLVWKQVCTDTYKVGFSLIFVLSHFEMSFSESSLCRCC